MAKSQPSSSLNVVPSQPVPPPPPPRPPGPDVARSINETATVVNLSSLTATSGQPASLANVTQSNVTANTNRGTQNAIANQQAHAQLALTVLGKTVNKVANLGPLTSRTSVAVLTDNSLADAIASLKAVLEAFGTSPGRPNRPAAVRALKVLARELELIVLGNARLTGTGTLTDPYTTIEGPIFFAAPATIGFVTGTRDPKVNFEVERNGGLLVG